MILVERQSRESQSQSDKSLVNTHSTEMNVDRGSTASAIDNDTFVSSRRDLPDLFAGLEQLANEFARYNFA